jgi:putative glycosyltransferase (TIGR04348 family)
VNTVIVSPSAGDSTEGNSITADRWARILRTLGHAVSITKEWNGEPFDTLIALHGRRSHSSIQKFREANPQHPLILALTGTDLYVDGASNREVLESLHLATRVIVLQSAALEMLPEEVLAKACVIYQSGAPPPHVPAPSGERFDVCVLSHLREVKDPLRAASASRLLPATSKVRIFHAGRALDPKWEVLARQEERENARYRWVGEQSHDAAMELLGGCQLFVLSSAAEGGANAIAEAVVCGVPVLCSDIQGNVGMLDRDYPGYFPYGDTERLAQMLYRAETEPAFLNELRGLVAKMRTRFLPDTEVACWDRLLGSLTSFGW